jgi:DNA-binding MarR family transcriptional regulator
MGSFNNSPNHLSGLLTLLGRLVQDRLKDELGELGLTYAQTAALVRVWRADGEILQRDLVNSLALSRATGTLLIADLEGLGLVERTTDPADMRRQLIRLTRKGRRLEEPVFEAVQAFQGELLSVLDEDELETTISALTRVLRHLEPATASALPAADRGRGERRRG